MRPERGVLLALFVAGCPAPKSSEGLQTTPVAQLFDHDAFLCGAMPVLIRHCSYTGCHGNEVRAFRVYSPGKLRMGDVATRAERDAMLTSDEIEANYASATGVLLQDHAAAGASVDVKTAPLLQKPLQARFGGSQHHGIGVFPFPPAQTLEADAEWQSLVSWVAGDKEPTPPTADCQALMTALQGGS